MKVTPRLILFLNMHLKSSSIIACCFQLVLVLFSRNVKAQNEDAFQNDSVSQIATTKSFHAGLYIGGFWANKNTAYIYDGYGFDQNGQRNSFGNSMLYNQIVNVYGGANGGNDYIAQLLNVDHKDWYFNEQGMPFNLRYTTTYLVGLNTRYQIDKKASITLNINASKLVVNGKFNINTTTTAFGFQNQSKLNQFTITGAEQRLMFQFGYQRILGSNEKMNFLLEGGMNIIMSKAQKNQVYITVDPSSGQNNSQNNITFDLMPLYSQPPYNYYATQYLIGVGIGAFAGVGINFNINPKYTVQLLYNPSYDRINLGYAPQFKIQHGVGLRIYYNLS
jgi:hypothetical protein